MMHDNQKLFIPHLAIVSDFFRSAFVRFAPMRGIYFFKKTCDNIFF